MIRETAARLTLGQRGPQQPTLRSSPLLLRRGLRFRATVPAFEVDSGLCLVLGRNGAGKSTLLEVFAGRRKPHSGSITLGGARCVGLRGRAVLRRTVGYLPQEARLPSTWTVVEYLSYASWLRGAGRAEATREARAVAARLELPEPERRTLSSLSGGMRRRVLIGQALVGRPELVVLDEPDAGLDRDAASGLARLLGQVGGHDLDDPLSVLAHVPVIAAVHRVDEFTGTAAQVVDLSASADHPR